MGRTEWVKGKKIALLYFNFKNCENYLQMRNIKHEMSEADPGVTQCTLYMNNFKNTGRCTV